MITVVTDRLPLTCPAGCAGLLRPMSRWAPNRLCAECGTGYYVPPELTQDFERFWGDEGEPTQEQWEQWGGEDRQWSWLMDAAAATTSDRVLDLGCGFGHFVDWAAKRGWDAWGTEPDSWARERSLVGGRVAASLPEIPGHFDVVTAGDVLEHIVEPLQMVKAVLPRMSGGGRILIGVPSFEGIQLRWPLLRRNDEMFRHHVRPTEHVSQFTETGLRRLLELAGFTHVVRLHPPLNRHSNPVLNGLIKRFPHLRESMFMCGTAPGPPSADTAGER